MDIQIFFWKEWQNLDHESKEVDVDVCNDQIVQIPIDNEDDYNLYPVVYSLITGPTTSDMEVSDLGNNGTHVWLKVISNNTLISKTETISLMAINSYEIYGTQYRGLSNKTLDIKITVFGWQDN